MDRTLNWVQLKYIFNEYNSRMSFTKYHISEAGCSYACGVNNCKCTICAHTVNARLLRMIMSIILTFPLDAKFWRNYCRRIFGAIKNPWEKFQNSCWEKVTGAIWLESSREAPSLCIIISPSFGDNPLLATRYMESRLLVFVICENIPGSLGRLKLNWILIWIEIRSRYSFELSCVLIWGLR